MPIDPCMIAHEKDLCQLEISIRVVDNGYVFPKDTIILDKTGYKKATKNVIRRGVTQIMWDNRIEWLEGYCIFKFLWKQDLTIPNLEL